MEGKKPAEIISGAAPVLFSSACLLSQGKQSEAERLLYCAAEMLLQAAVRIRSDCPSGRDRPARTPGVFQQLGLGESHLTEALGKLVELRCRLADLRQTEYPARHELTGLLEKATLLTAMLGQAVRDISRSNLK